MAEEKISANLTNPIKVPSVYSNLNHYQNRFNEGIDYLKKYPLYRDKIAMLNPLPDNILELVHLKNYFVRLQSDYSLIVDNIDIENYRSNSVYTTIFDDVIEKITNQIKNKISPYLQITVTFANDEIVNGYSIGNYKNLVIMDGLFTEYFEYWNDNTNMTFKEFKKSFYNNLFTRGYYNYSKESQDKLWDLTLSPKDNCKILYELQYPKNFILRVTRSGISFKDQLIPHCIYVGELMKRKVDAIDKN